MEIVDSQIKLSYGTSKASSGILRLKSAYAAVNQRSGTGEMLYSTMPIQNPYPFTVDYVL